MYTSSASFKIASVSLKSKAFSTSGNYLWNPLTWLVHNTHPVEGSREKREGKIFKKRKKKANRGLILKEQKKKKILRFYVKFFHDEF